MSKKTIYQLKRDLQVFEEQFEMLNDQIEEEASKGNAQEVLKRQKEQDDIKISIEALEQQIKRREEKEFSGMKEIKKDNPVENKGIMYRSMLKGEPIPDDIYRSLFGVDNTPNNGGNNFIPTNLSDDLIFDSLKNNPIRDIATITNIVGLELPKVSYTIDEMEFVKDGEVAKEVALKGEKVKFGSFAFRISTEISDSLLDGTNTNLVEYIDKSLKDGLAKKEKHSIFKASKAEEKHMNIYSDTNAVKKVQGETLFKAIKNALSDLSDEFYNNATIVMKKSDYFTMIDELSNNNTNFYDKQSDQILGTKVVFCEDADKPIVGDFSYLHINYSSDVKLESERTAREGRNYFILSGSFDIRLLLTSAFRIAEVTPSVLNERKKKDN